MVLLTESLVADSSTTQRSEIELLLCCTRTQISPEYADRIRHLVSQNLDWDYLVQTARWHGVLPLLYRQLKDICPSAVPQDVLLALRSKFQANAYKNLHLTAELLILLDVFKEKNIPVLPFKGPLLAISVYKQLAMRDFVDLDILVPKEFVVSAGDLLNACGYSPQFNLSAALTKSYINIGNEQMFKNTKKQITIDLHWHLLPKPFPDNDTLVWSNCELVYYETNILQTLSAENLLLYLCEHGAKHSWSHLKFICDLAELIRSHPDLDWDWILTQSGQRKTRRMLFLSLYLCQHLLDTVLPEKLCQQLPANQAVAIIASQVQNQLFSPSKESGNIFKQRRIYINTLSWKDRLWVYLSTLITPTPLELTAIPLPNWLFPLYYLIRPIRLTIKHGTQKFNSVWNIFTTPTG